MSIRWPFPRTLLSHASPRTSRWRRQYINLTRFQGRKRIMCLDIRDSCDILSIEARVFGAPDTRGSDDRSSDDGASAGALPDESARRARRCDRALLRGM